MRETFIWWCWSGQLLFNFAYLLPGNDDDDVYFAFADCCPASVRNWRLAAQYFLTSATFGRIFARFCIHRKNWPNVHNLQLRSVLVATMLRPYSYLFFLLICCLISLIIIELGQHQYSYSSSILFIIAVIIHLNHNKIWPWLIVIIIHLCQPPFSSGCWSPTVRTTTWYQQSNIHQSY